HPPVTGARIALLNAGAREEIEALVQRIEKIETAVEPRFQDHFMKAIAILHDELEFPNLARAIKLPVRTREDAKSPIEASGLSRRQQHKLRLT
ncbi:MAG: ASKHA domain-containing protein, partial [Gammaproteobacteria bacterium]|nr:ASKHA domain-containing protein [Gammaproteobacteria bacterium]